ncbi:MAG: nuclear transport factor 2 family protein [Bdellovibrio sp.]|nr:nuclear transport factor 2 family protein [Bdellovibrio sp.]
MDAWSGNRPDFLLSFYSENAYYQDPAHPNGLRGHHEILSYFKKLLAKNPNWRWECQEIFSTEKGFTLKWCAHIPGLNPIIGLDIVEITDNQITRNEVYFDTALMRPGVTR